MDVLLFSLTTGLRINFANSSSTCGEREICTKRCVGVRNLWAEKERERERAVGMTGQCHFITPTASIELGNEAKLITLNNKPRVVVTDSGCTTMVSLRGPGIYYIVIKQCNFFVCANTPIELYSCVPTPTYIYNIYIYYIIIYRCIWINCDMDS